MPIFTTWHPTWGRLLIYLIENEQRQSKFSKDSSRTRRYRAVFTKLINETKALLDEEQLNRGRLLTITELLDEKSTIVKGLDEKLLDVCKLDDIGNKIEEADELYSRILDVQGAIKDILNDEATKPLQENVTEISPITHSGK